MIKSLGRTWIALMLACGVCRAQGAEDNFDAASRFMAARRYAAAFGVYERLAAGAGSGEARAQALLLGGSVLGFGLARPAAALEWFEQVLSRYPDTRAAADALFQCGVLHHGQGRMEHAAAAFSGCVERYPGALRSMSAARWLSRLRAMSDSRVMRVLVAEGKTRLSIRARKDIRVLDRATGMMVCPPTPEVDVTAGGGRLHVNGQAVSARALELISDAAVMSLDGWSSRGRYRVFLDRTGLRVVNCLPLESYLYGIVAREMPHTWSEQALRAQAVASRTYALYLRARNRHMPFDVDASIVSQVYGGCEAETPATTRAVDATRGQVLTFGGRIAAAYFHADSGGHTEDPRYVWEIDAPYLKGVPDRFSDRHPKRRWQCRLTYAELARILGEAGVARGAVHSIRIAAISPTGRVRELQVESDAGLRRLSGNHFRINVGGTRVRSTFFTLTPLKDAVLISGKGYGHGVGMSQWGACRMAELGYGYAQILAYYYPGTCLADAARLADGV